MISTTTFFATLMVVSMVTINAEEPICFQMGRKLFGKNLDGLCVHDTADFSRSHDVVDGIVEIILPRDTTANLEIYSDARIVTEYEDCCPPPSFTYELFCNQIQATGQCCYDESNVYVTDLPDISGCVHSVEDYASYVPSNNSASWSTKNPQANHEVEVYASLMPDGCCGCFLYSVPCSPCSV